LLPIPAVHTNLSFRGTYMKTSVKIVIALLVIVVVASGGYYAGRLHKSGGGAEAPKGEQAAQGKVLYTCPMHPFIIKDKPGACPICGMALVKKIEGGDASQQEKAGADQVVLSPSQQVKANVATVTARKMPFARSIDAVGIVQYDQARQAKVTAWVSGRLDKLYVDKVGAYVTAKRPVAEVYSPDLVATQQEFLLALKSRDRLKDSPVGSIAQGGEGLVASARQRLKLWGVKESQIAALEKEGKPNIRLPIYTPLSGIVVDKLVLEGQYVKEGDPLFSVADLSTVWVEAELYENEFPNVKLGQRVEILSQSYPGTTFAGKVSYIYPFLDPKTRTVKVRVALANPGLRLKPDMFVNASIKVPLGNVMAVPVTAVMDTGMRKVVWIEVKKGTYEPRDVETGPRVGDYIQIVSGLQDGDTVVSSGGYLIDSEAQLKGGGGSGAMPGMKMDEKKAPAPPAGPAKKDEMDMKDMKM
jgi:Cu(I)/Ag(I) efflux system membrane fusion protein